MTDNSWGLCYTVDKRNWLMVVVGILVCYGYDLPWDSININSNVKKNSNEISRFNVVSMLITAKCFFSCCNNNLCLEVLACNISCTTAVAYCIQFTLQLLVNIKYKCANMSNVVKNINITAKYLYVSMDKF